MGKRKKTSLRPTPVRRGLVTVGLSLAAVGVAVGISEADDRAAASRQDDTPDHGYDPQAKAERTDHDRTAKAPAKHDARKVEAPATVEHERQSKGHGHQGKPQGNGYGHQAKSSATDTDYTRPATADYQGNGQRSGYVPGAANSQYYGQSRTQQPGNSQYGTDECVTSDRNQASDQYAPQQRAPRSGYGLSGLGNALSRYGL